MMLKDGSPSIRRSRGGRTLPESGQHEVCIDQALPCLEEQFKLTPHVRTNDVKTYTEK